MLNIFIGYDKNETVAYHVLAHSLIRRATSPISITPICRDHFPYFTRERGPLESTDFSISRFLVPYLSGYAGYSLFMDCDMLCRVPIHEVWQAMDPRKFQQKAVWVCPHDYVPKDAPKMLGQVQTVYPRKNWSSFMFFDNDACRILTPDYVNTATGLHLHRFEWLPDDAQIGFLPLEWNWLVEEYAPNDQAKMLHYTLGGPWWGKYRSCDHAEEWFDEFRHMTGMDYFPTQAWECLPPMGEKSPATGNPLSHGECFKKT